MSSMLNRKIKIETSKQCYIGQVVAELFKSNKYHVKITDVIKGDKKVGQTAKFSISDCITL